MTPVIVRALRGCRAHAVEELVQLKGAGLRRAISSPSTEANVSAQFSPRHLHREWPAASAFPGGTELIVRKTPARRRAGRDGFYNPEAATCKPQAVLVDCCAVQRLGRVNSFI